MPDVLEVAEGLRYQTTDERIAYQITTTNWVSSPTSTAVVAYDENDGSNVTSTVFPANSPSESGDVISLSLLRELSLNHTYRIEVKFTVSSNIYECYFRVKCER